MQSNHYTTPRIVKGKAPLNIPKGSNKEIELAKNSWFIEYRFNGKQIRIRPNSLNRIKDHREKQYATDVELETLKIKLRNGFNPLNPDEYLNKIIKEQISLSAAIQIFLDYHTKHQSKPKTISSYKSKLTDLLTTVGDVELTTLKTKQLENFIIDRVEDDSYSQKTVKFAKTTFTAFYNVLISLGYNLTNQASSINKKIKSFKETKEKHLPYSKQQLTDMMEYLDANDDYTALFARFIYFTCLRPSELRQLQVRDINLKTNTITVRASTKKTTKNVSNDLIDLPVEFKPFLDKLNLDNANPTDYILGDTATFTSKTMIGINTPLTRLQKALKHLKIEALGYGLYSFKHTSNILRWQTGKWNLDQIMVANRHTNIQQTLTYLRDLNKETSIKGLPVPAI